MSTPALTNLQTRDIEAVVHPYTPLHKLRTEGPTVIERGKGVYVYDTQGRAYIEGMSGLWCAGLGFGDEEMIEAATEQMRHALLLPSVRLEGHGAGDRAGREAQGNRAGADLAGVLHLVGLGGQRQPGQARLVRQQRAREA